jgi:TIGR01777 family protein
MKVLITGATGLIGKEIGKKLAENGHEIFIVSRSLAKARENLPFPCEVIRGDLTHEVIHDEKLKNIEGVINLLGEGIADGRWNEARKKRIYESRIEGTRNLIKSLPQELKVCVSGSAMGFYGDGKESVLTEDSTAGDDFLAKVCVDWEAEAKKASGRKVFIRTSMVLSPDGGALEKMMFPFRLGLGGNLGDGKQWMSWIHIDDIVGLFVHALENENVQGPVNGCSPYPVRNHEFTQNLAGALGKGTGPAVPVLALKVLFGELAESLVYSQQGDAKKAITLGYKFKHEKLQEALRDICAPFKSGEERFYAEQFLAEPPEKVFEFFKDPNNLERITPELLNFHIAKVSTTDIGQGTLIDYKMKIRGIPLTWKTEIDEWKPPFKFVDNQTAGPYTLWHHTHEFKPFAGGTLMTDHVRYKLPMGFLGWAVAQNFVKKDVANIFSFRRKFIANLKDERK